MCIDKVVVVLTRSLLVVKLDWTARPFLASQMLLAAREGVRFPVARQATRSLRAARPASLFVQLQSLLPLIPLFKRNSSSSGANEGPRLRLFMVEARTLATGEVFFCQYRKSYVELSFFFLFVMTVTRTRSRFKIVATALLHFAHQDVFNSDILSSRVCAGPSLASETRMLQSRLHNIARETVIGNNRTLFIKGPRSLLRPLCGAGRALSLNPLPNSQSLPWHKDG